MKSVIKLYLLKTREPAQEFDDDGPYNYPVEPIEISYNHYFFNKYWRRLKAVKEYAKSISGWPYSIVLTTDIDYHGIRIMDGWVIDLYGKRITSNKLYK